MVKSIKIQTERSSFHPTFLICKFLNWRFTEINKRIIYLLGGTKRDGGKYQFGFSKLWAREKGPCSAVRCFHVQLIETLSPRSPGLQIAWSIRSVMCKLIFKVVISLSEVFSQSNSARPEPRVVFSQFICCEFSMKEFPVPVTASTPRTSFRRRRAAFLYRTACPFYAAFPRLFSHTRTSHFQPRVGKRTEKSTLFRSRWKIINSWSNGIK